MCLSICYFLTVVQESSGLDGLKDELSQAALSVEPGNLLFGLHTDL